MSVVDPGVRRARWPAIMLVLLTSGCSTNAATIVPDQSKVAATLSTAGPRVWIKDAGRIIPFGNGQTIRRGSIVVEIFVAPYPPGRVSNVDFYLTSDGSAVTTANVTLQWDMTLMDHGPFELLAVPDGRGHYLARLDFFMSGDFWLNVSMRTPASEEILNMLVRAIR